MIEIYKLLDLFLDMAVADFFIFHFFIFLFIFIYFFNLTLNMTP